VERQSTGSLRDRVLPTAGAKRVRGTPSLLFSRAAEACWRCRWPEPEISLSTSLIYRSAIAYELAMLAIYGRHYRSRLTVIAGLIPAGASVLELCCGPGRLYTSFLRKKGVLYTGLDANPRFIRHLRGKAARNGVTGLVFDLNSSRRLPLAEYAVMQASLYHFLPDASAVIESMLLCSRREVIISEPIRNLSSSGSPLIAEAGRRMTDPGSGNHIERFTELTLDDLMSRYEAQFARSFLIAGGREKVYVLRGARA
jgi:SAM-dependent methyltransferase